MRGMKPYSEDLRTRIVRAVEDGMPQVLSCPPLRREPLLRQALPRDRPARSVAGAEEGGRKRPPKIDQNAHKLLEEDVEERPAATVAERRRFLESAPRARS